MQGIPSDDEPEQAGSANPVTQNPTNPSQSQNPLNPTQQQPPGPNPPDQANPNTGYWSHSQNAQVTMSSLEQEIETFHNWDHLLSPWRSTTNFYPNYLYEEEGKSIMIKSLFRSYAHYTLSKWRQIGSPMPKLYPAQSEWTNHHDMGVLIQ